MSSINALSKTPSSALPLSSVDPGVLEKGQVNERAIPFSNVGSQGLVDSRSSYLMLGTLTLLAIYLFSGRFMRFCAS